MASLSRNANKFARLAPSPLRRGLASGAPAASVQGLNFNISEEQQELVDLAEKFTREEVIPNAAHYDQVCDNVLFFKKSRLTVQALCVHTIFRLNQIVDVLSEVNDLFCIF
jgi:hypothetical protein